MDTPSPQGMLAPSPDHVELPFPPDQNIILVGLMGAGKTTVGRQLARALGRPFVDSDHEIEARMGVPIPTIFEIEGEAGFRKRESQVIADLVQLRGLVLATGGGAVLSEANRHCLHNNGWVVYLNVPPRQLFERTRTDRNRPLLQVADPLARLQELHACRDPLYREAAHIVIEGRRMGASGITQFLIKEFQKHADADRCTG